MATTKATELSQLSSALQVDESTGEIIFTGSLSVDSNTLFVDGDANRVGIGTLTPSSALDVSGDVTLTGSVDGRNVSSDGSKLDTIESNADVTDTANVTSAGALMDSELTNESAVKNIDQELTTTSSVNFGSLDVDSGTLYVDSANGRVGVGTSSPSEKLEVNGDSIINSSNASPLTLRRNAGGSSNVSIKFDGANRDFYSGIASESEDFVIGLSANLNQENIIRAASNGDISFYEDTGTTPKFFWDASAERLGIGTSSPNRKLKVQDSVGTVVEVSSTGTVGGGISMGDSNTSPNAVRLRGEGNSMTFTTDNSEAARIDSDGNVGIGTSSPSSKLTVQGNIESSEGMPANDIKQGVRTSDSNGEFQISLRGYSFGVFRGWRRNQLVAITVWNNSNKDILSAIAHSANYSHFTFLSKDSQRGFAGDVNFTADNSTGSRFLTFTNLAVNTSYNYEIRALDLFSSSSSI